MTYFLLSASVGSVPGRVMVIVFPVEELMSYFLCGFLQTFILTRAMNTVLDRIATMGCNRLGKKLLKKFTILNIFFQSKKKNINTHALLQSM